MEARRTRFAARRLTILMFVAAAAIAKAQTQASVITEITVEGNKFVTKESILARMSAKVGQPYVQAQLDQDKGNLERLGFFKAVDVRAIPLDGSNWKVAVQVAEFDVVKEIRVVGNSVISTDKIMKVLTVQVGQPYNLNDQKPSGDAIAKLYSEKGYFALVDQLEPLDDSPGTVAVSVREMTVNSITLTGNNRTKDRVMKRLIKTRPGDAYNDPKWIRDLQRIMNTQWFEKVQPNEKQTEEGFAVDLMVDLKEARTGQVILGATVDPRSSIAGQIKLMDTNFNGTGQTVGIGLSQAVTGGGTSGELEYTNPFIDRHDTSISVSLYSRLVYHFSSAGFGGGGSSSDQFNERRSGLAVGLVRPMNEHNSVSMGLRFESIRTSDVATSNPTTFIQQDGELLQASLGFVRNRRDLDIDPSRGDYFAANIEPGFSHITKIGGAILDPSILGNSSFVRNSLEYRAYYSPQPPRTGREIDAPRRVFAFRAKYGFISGKVPFNEQFFAGGSDTLRGYEDDRFWGRNTFISSFEYRHPLQKAFNAVLFMDVGGAWGGYGKVNNFDQSGSRLHVGYGIGFGFKTPLGNLRLDFGFGEKGKSRTHFMIGTSF